MKWTPQKAITDASVLSPEKTVLELGQLVVVSEDDGVASGGELLDLGAQRRDLGIAQPS